MKNPQQYKGLRVTIMGLGLNGGGLASAKFFANRGAIVTATDLRSKELLAPSLEALRDYNIKYTLGEHKMEDFETADMVIKNPAVPKGSPFLRASKRVETDLSIFLSQCKNPIIGVTGSKGKSSLVSALYAILKPTFPHCYLGGNITISPLNFIDKLDGKSPIILELSSWQLGDLKGRGLLHPRVAVITNIMNDHQNMYETFDDYVDDKRVVFQNTIPQGLCLFGDDKWGNAFTSEAPAKVTQLSLTESLTSPLLPQKLLVPGEYFRLNALFAAKIASFLGISTQDIHTRLSEFKGLKDRLECIDTINGVSYYNDTTATIPEALMAGVFSFTKPVHLIAGGSDKHLDYTPTKKAFLRVKSISLLSGKASDKIIKHLKEWNIPYNGPYDSMKEAFLGANREANPEEIVLLSPGATSFGLFKNEFERGELFKKEVRSLQ